MIENASSKANKACINKQNVDIKLGAPRNHHLNVAGKIITTFNSFIAKDPYMAPLLAIRYATRRSTKMVKNNSTFPYYVRKIERRTIFSKFEFKTIPI